MPVRDIVRDALANATNTAIIGPNHLEISFPAAYHMFKLMCEQPANLDRLQKIAGDLVGRAVRITCRLESPSTEAAVKPAKPSLPKGVANERKPAADSNDPYAEQARSIFGATIVRVEPVSMPKPELDGGEE